MEKSYLLHNPLVSPETSYLSLNLSTLEMTANDIYQSLSFVFLIIHGFWISTSDSCSRPPFLLSQIQRRLLSHHIGCVPFPALYRLSLADPSTLWHKSPWCFLWWTQLCLLILQTHHCIHTQLRQSRLYYTRAFQTLWEIKCLHEQNNILIKNLSLYMGFSTSSLRTRNQSVGLGGEDYIAQAKWTATNAILSTPISSPVPQALYPGLQAWTTQIWRNTHTMLLSTCQKFQSA